MWYFISKFSGLRISQHQEHSPTHTSIFDKIVTTWRKSNNQRTLLSNILPTCKCPHCPNNVTYSCSFSIRDHTWLSGHLVSLVTFDLKPYSRLWGWGGVFTDTDGVKGGRPAISGMSFDLDLSDCFLRSGFRLTISADVLSRWCWDLLVHQWDTCHHLNPWRVSTSLIMANWLLKATMS